MEASHWEEPLNPVDLASTFIHILIILIILLILIFFIIIYHEYLDYPQGLENEQQGPFEGSGDNFEDDKLTMIIS